MRIVQANCLCEWSCTGFGIHTSWTLRALVMSPGMLRHDISRRFIIIREDHSCECSQSFTVFLNIRVNSWWINEICYWNVCYAHRMHTVHRCGLLLQMLHGMCLLSYPKAAVKRLQKSRCRLGCDLGQGGGPRKLCISRWPASHERKGHLPPNVTCRDSRRKIKFLEL